jgi:integrase
MTQQEFQAILRASGGKKWKKPTPGARFRRILLYLWLTGCRPSEAAVLTWDNVDFERRLVTLKEHKTSRTQKTPRPRIIPLHPVLVKRLRWIERQDEGHTVFLSHRRAPWDKDTLSSHTTLPPGVITWPQKNSRLARFAAR